MLNLPISDTTGGRIKFLMALLDANQREFSRILDFDYRQLGGYLVKLKTDPNASAPSKLIKAISKLEVDFNGEKHSVNMNFITKGMGEPFVPMTAKTTAKNALAEDSANYAPVTKKTIQEALEINARAISQNTILLIELNGLLKQLLKEKKE